MKQRKGSNSKIQLLHLVYGLRVGGAEMLIFLYIKALDRKDYDHYVYFFGVDGPIRNRIESLGVPVYRGKKITSIKKPIRFAVSLINLVRDLLSLIKNKQIKIIQSHLSHANQLAVAVGKLSGVPTFPTIHNTMESIDRRNNWDFRVHLRKLVESVIYRMADRLIVVSQEIKEIISRKSGVKNSKILVVKNGIIFEDNANKNDNPSPYKLEEDYPNSTKKIIKLIAVGRLTYQKNFEVLIKAIDCVIDRGFKDLLVMVVGTGEEKLRLKNLIRELDLTKYIKLLGIRHDVLELMKASDLFVMPSRYEGLSIAMIEAMACGLPVIASDVSGIRSYVINGQNGILFPVNNHTSLAEYLILLSNDVNQRTQLSIGAKNTFKREFDLCQNIRSLDTLFREYATK